MARSTSRALAIPWFTASAASFASIATVRMTTRPGTSATLDNAMPAACSAPTAASYAPSLQSARRATASRVHVR